MCTNNPFAGRFALAFFTLIFALSLAGCGGGGGGSSGGGASSVTPTLANRVGSNGAAVNTEARVAAVATPRQGSVTQSSTVDGGGVTRDQVTARVEYDRDDGELWGSIQKRGTVSWNVDPGDDTLLRSSTLFGTNTRRQYQERLVARRVNGGAGTVFVDVFTNRLSPADTDYLAGGVWLYVPDDTTAVSDIELGAFMDGSITPTPSAYLTTTATASYAGDATGLYVATDGGQAAVGEFVGDLSLTARFGATPTVSGAINNLAEIDASRTTLTPITGGPTLQLGSARIDSSSAGGFFTGDTLATHIVDGVTERYEGKWGGQFYGAQADYVGGTFGARQTTVTDGSDLTFVGAYGAYKLGATPTVTGE